MCIRDRLLRGKVPGVDITSQSGVTGTGTNIIIRGYTSISGSNQPLFVLDGVPIEDTILIYPKGSGSTVAPFVLMGLIYTGKGPKGIINRDVCPLTLPAASLLALPYGHGFDTDPTLAINDGDSVEMSLEKGQVQLTVISRASED